ncbi:tRNA (adenosine(37)-N6)-threonylcarbamoyltransferase complex ATPase subunit type 1 TsaE [Aeoliella sp. SH292]|uniref:tRNA (adenosine(37)-N6)-threonylcarbamoyltransferase complex ATPase subunit type 1 TsaE n=1 Tax=Aeoliella sp. SH292 TaxID=3454464 RepID=UPI003F992DF1
MTAFDFTSRSLEDTDELGARIAKVLAPGDVVALVGTLGAGKTRLVQAIAAALGNDRAGVTSPTFVLVNEYTAGRLPLYHFDVYRLKDDDEFLELGAEEYFDRSGVTLIEWGDRVEHLLPPRASVVTIEFDEGGNRLVRIVGTLAERLGASAVTE